MRFIIVGNGAAGNAAVCAILRRRPGAEISIISSESHPFYSRVLMSHYVAGSALYQDVFLPPPAARPNVRWLLGTTVSSISPGERSITLAGGEMMPYDRLLLATGSNPVMPGIPGVQLPGVFALRTLDDAVAIREWAKGARAAVVLGGGMIGLKAAEALFHLGLKVTVVASSTRLLSQSLDEDSARIVQAYLENAGVHLRLSGDAAEILGRGRVEYVRLKSRETIAAGMVVIGKGVAPDISLVKGSPIRTNRGILVDQFLQTSAPGVYAAGDVCEAPDPVVGSAAVNALWTVAVRQGAIAGDNMAGGHYSLDGSFAENSFRFGGLCVTSVGRPHVVEGGRVFAHTDSAGYRRVVLRDGRIVGAVEAGEGHSIGILRARLLAPWVSPRKTEALAHAFVRGNLSFAHVVISSGAVPSGYGRYRFQQRRK